MSKALHIVLITLSDRASGGDYEDISGPTAKSYLENAFATRTLSFTTSIIPDDTHAFTATLRTHIGTADLIFTLGSTGIGPRDIAPDVTRTVIEKEIPGIGEAMRAYSLQFTKNAMLSRATAGLSGKTLIVNLPGSPKAVKEILGYITDIIGHSIHMIQGEDVH